MQRQKGVAKLTVGLLAAVAIVALIFGGSSIMTWLAPGGADNGWVPSGPTVHCQGGESQSLDLNAVDVDAPATALTEANNIHRVVGDTASLGAVTFGTALTGLQTGQSYEVITGISGTAASCYDNAYGPWVKAINLPCVLVKTVKLFQDELEGDVTATFYDSNHDASAETLVASTATTVYLKFHTADKEYFGNPYIGEAPYMGKAWNDIKVSGLVYVKGSTIGSHRPEYSNTVCLQMNTSNHNQPTFVKAHLQDGSIVEMRKVSTPTVHTAATGDSDWCYEAPILTSSSIEIEVRINPKADIAGADDGTASYYASSRYMNTDTGTISWGCEDNDGNAIGASDPDTLTMDFTA